MCLGGGKKAGMFSPLPQFPHLNQGCERRSHPKGCLGDRSDAIQVPGAKWDPGRW